MAGVGADPDQAGDLAGDPRLFLGLAHDRFGDRLAEIHAATGDGPVTVVGAPDHQDLALTVDGDHVGRRDHAGGAKTQTPSPDKGSEPFRCPETPQGGAEGI
jgi:hypothetical protein